MKISIIGHSHLAYVTAACMEQFHKVNVDDSKVIKQNEGGDDPTHMLELVDWLLSEKSDGVSGRFISAKWDAWKNFNAGNLDNDIYRLRRSV